MFQIDSLGTLMRLTSRLHLAQHTFSVYWKAANLAAIILLLTTLIIIIIPITLRYLLCDISCTYHVSYYQKYSSRDRAS